MDSSSENSLVSLSELTVFGSERAMEIRLWLKGFARGACDTGGLEVNTGVPGGSSMSNVEDLETGDNGESFVDSRDPCALWAETATTGSVKYLCLPFLRKELNERFKRRRGPVSGTTAEDCKSR
jgi:hypothetical protein